MKRRQRFLFANVTCLRCGDSSSGGILSPLEKGSVGVFLRSLGTYSRASLSENQLYSNVYWFSQVSSSGGDLD